jgi:hypothetical protein
MSVEAPGSTTASTLVSVHPAPRPKVVLPGFSERWFYPGLVNGFVKSPGLVFEGTHLSRRAMRSATVVEAFDVIEHICSGLLPGSVVAPVDPFSFQ